MPIYELYMADLKVSSEDYHLQFQLHKVTIRVALQLQIQYRAEQKIGTIFVRLDFIKY